MKFKLLKKVANASRTTYHIIDSAGTVCGSVSVPPSQEADLLKHWAGEKAAPPATKQSAANAIVAAFKRGPKLSRQGILRAC